MKTRALTLAILASASTIAFAVPASAALTVETAPFITNITNSTSFEGLGSITGPDGVSSYSEDGISVDYIGTIAAGGIWSEGQAAPDGQYSWYPDGGGFGYTRITFADTDQIQFLAGAGFFAPPTDLAYEVLLNGVSIGTGVAGPTPQFGNGFVSYGFSGALFDEIRLQVVSTGGPFDPTGFEAGTYDLIQLGASAVVPEPASWAMMIAGFGMAGAALRRRASRVAFA